MDKEKLLEVIDKINEHKAAIGLHRDAMRELINEIESILELINEVESICDDVDDASHSLEYAADALSRLL